MRNVIATKTIAMCVIRIKIERRAMAHLQMMRRRRKKQKMEEATDNSKRGPPEDTIKRIKPREAGREVTLASKM
jgi:hypothetical protein